MDTSETYIKMCEKAEVIQKAWLPKEWDLYQTEADGKKHVWAVLPGDIADSGVYGRIYIDTGFWGKSDPKVINEADFSIWLPRQDQLQAMVRNKYPRQYLMIVNFAEYCVDSVDGLSLEQLWLAFVMKDNGKIWDGDNWVD